MLSLGHGKPRSRHFHIPLPHLELPHLQRKNIPRSWAGIPAWTGLEPSHCSSCQRAKSFSSKKTSPQRGFFPWTASGGAGAVVWVRPWGLSNCYSMKSCQWTQWEFNLRGNEGSISPLAIRPDCSCVWKALQVLHGAGMFQAGSMEYSSRSCTCFLQVSFPQGSSTEHPELSLSGQMAALLSLALFWLSLFGSEPQFNSTSPLVLDFWSHLLLQSQNNDIL